jgi:hypothetical protein
MHRVYKLFMPLAQYWQALAAINNISTCWHVANGLVFVQARHARPNGLTCFCHSADPESSSIIYGKPAMTGVFAHDH